MRMVLALTVLVACGGPGLDGGTGGDMDGPDACGADKMMGLVGLPIDGLRGRFPDPARIIPPGAPVTEDYSPGRVNVDLDGNGVIKRIWCG